MVELLTHWAQEVNVSVQSRKLLDLDKLASPPADWPFQLLWGPLGRYPGSCKRFANQMFRRFTHLESVLHAEGVFAEANRLFVALRDRQAVIGADTEHGILAS
jgi:hypothetical protein